MPSIDVGSYFFMEKASPQRDFVSDVDFASKNYVMVLYAVANVNCQKRNSVSFFNFFVGGYGP